MAKRAGPFAPPVEAAQAASLRYVTDARPGIRRRRAGPGFRYFAPDGQPVRDPAMLARIRALAVPPAWRDVWICPAPEGHLQATGRDARGRKQYRYHPRWRRVRDETKFERMLLFGAALPRIRSRVRQDLRLTGLPREKVLATIVRLLETSFIRVGNEEYARANRSFGLTTLRTRHVAIAGDTLRFQFTGKGGKPHAIAVNDRRLAALVKRCRELPGQELFQFLDAAGQPQPIDSGAVNEYLRSSAAGDFTAKDFRTWAGTLLAAELLEQAPGVVAAAQAVAERLGNTPAICRRCYIHPAVLAGHQNRRLAERWTAIRSSAARRRGLSGTEATLLRFLREFGGRTPADLLEASRPPTPQAAGAARRRGKGRSAGRPRSRRRARGSTARRTSAGPRYTRAA